MYEKADRSKLAKVTVDFDGMAFRSGFECRARECLDIWHREYHHERLSIRDLLCGKGQYSPDFTLLYPEDSSIEKPALLETKGFVDPNSEFGIQTYATWNRFRERVRKHEFEYFVRAWPKARIEIYEYPHNKTESAAVYTCPECGWTDFYAINRHTCRMCGCEDTEYTTNNLNKYANDFFLPVWTENVKRAHEQVKARLEEEREAKHWAECARRRLLKISNALPSFDFVTGTVKIRTPYNDNASFTPTGIYTEQRTDRAVFGTAFAPTAIIIANDLPTYSDEEVHEQLTGYIDARNTMFTKIIFMTKRGIEVYDETSDKREAGGYYRCDNCGKVYIAKHSHHGCPCCESSDTKALDTREAVR